jgi:hypothetical protein
MSSPLAVSAARRQALSCRELANDRRHRLLCRRASFEIARELCREELRALDCVFD